MRAIKKDSRTSFTLIELLIVIGIVAILGVTVVLTINPAELLRQARDARRLSEVFELSKLTNLFQIDNIGANLGDPKKIYVSVPDTAATCTNLNLPPPPSGYTYNCVTSLNLRKVDGSGWIPLDFTSLSTGSGFSSLPVDPINSPNSSLYYVYVPSTTGYVITSVLESEKYTEASAQNDGGIDPTRVEVGSDINLWAQATGLVGYWKFDEGAGTTANDSSGKGNHGALISNPRWVDGKINKGLEFFDPLNTQNLVRVQNTSTLSSAVSSSITISAWAKADFVDGYTFKILDKYNAADPSYGTYMLGGRSGGTNFVIYDSSLGFAREIFVLNDIQTSWTFVAGTFNRFGGSDNMKLYINGVLVGTPQTLGSLILQAGTNPLAIGNQNNQTAAFDGVIDEVRIYNRALSASEIQALYEAGL